MDNSKPTTMSERIENCPTCGTRCNVTVMGLDLVANSGDETLASKKYSPCPLPTFDEIQNESLLESKEREVEELKKAMKDIYNLSKEWSSTTHDAITAIASKQITK